MKVQVSPEHYTKKNYDSKERFISYWHQIHEITNLNLDHILEIGKGNGFVSDYLRNKSLNVTTLDFDRQLNPSIVGDVLHLPWKNESFNVVVCFEVLEHLPYENFFAAFDEIFRVTKKYSVISLPDVEKVYPIFFQIPEWKTIRRLIPLGRFRKLIHKFDGEHYWEIGKEGFALKRIMADIRKSGFFIEKTYRIFEFPYHRFFVLRK